MVRLHTRICQFSNEIIACIVAVGACLIGFIANQLPDHIFLPLFCRIPAHLAAGYYNAELSQPALIFSVHGTAIQVSRSCGAVTFFSMCASLLLVCLWQNHHRVESQQVAIPQNSGDRSQNPVKEVLYAGLFVFVAWVLTILVNAARLILIVPVTAVSGVLPERFGASIHMAAGMLVFMSAFVILWFLSEKVFLKRRKNE